MKKIGSFPIELEDYNSLWEVCERFIKDQEVGHPETIYQCDRVIENAYDFIYNVCNVVGYYGNGEDDE